VIHDLFAAQIWAGHPLGKPILGTRQLVESFGRDIIATHFGEEYVPPRIVIAVAGNVTHDRVVELFGRGFNGFTHEPPHRVAQPARIIPGVNIVQKTLEQVHVVIGFPGLHHAAPERYALFLLNDIVGGSMSSRLFQEVRERQGLVYSIHSGVQSYADTGTLYVYAATDAANFSKVLKSTLKELREVKKQGVTQDELKRSKDHLKGSLMLSLESTSSRMNRLASHEMRFGSFMTMDEMLAAIDLVQMDEVDALVHRVLDEEQLSLLTLGAVDRRHLPRGLMRS
jgi:predicted Zn-dependent peptidase